MFKLADVPYQLTYRLGDVERSTVYITKEELKNAVAVLYEIMEKEDTLEIRSCGYFQQLDGTEAYHIVRTFHGTEQKVSRLLANL